MVSPSGRSLRGGTAPSFNAYGARVNPLFNGGCELKVARTTPGAFDKPSVKRSQKRP
jgi:hypothetical protein